MACWTSRWRGRCRVSLAGGWRGYRKSQRPRPPRLVRVRHRGERRGTLAPPRGRTRLPLRPGRPLSPPRSPGEAGARPELGRVADGAHDQKRTGDRGRLLLRHEGVVFQSQLVLVPRRRLGHPSGDARLPPNGAVMQVGCAWSVARRTIGGDAALRTDPRLAGASSVDDVRLSGVGSLRTVRSRVTLVCGSEAEVPRPACCAVVLGASA